MDAFYLKDNIQTIPRKIESLKKLEEEIVDRMEDPLKQLSSLPPIQRQMPSQGQNVFPGLYASTSQFQASSPSPKKTAKLPKLEVKKFSGRIQEWQEFWDSFENAIDKNESLAAVDKFAYLRSLVVEPVRSTITGFSLTSANYKEAMEVLKKQYGKEIAIQRVHMNDLLNLPHIFNDKGTLRLRKLYDFRGRLSV